MSSFPNRHRVLSLLHQSLVGLKVRVVDHPDHTVTGLAGIIIAESRKTLTIRDEDGWSKMISKLPGHFSLWLASQWIDIEGQLLEGDGKRRSKRKLRHW